MGQVDPMVSPDATPRPATSGGNYWSCSSLEVGGVKCLAGLGKPASVCPQGKGYGWKIP
jgi:hypothetical protein